VKTLDRKKQPKPKTFAEVGRSFPVSGDVPQTERPKMQRLMRGGDGQIISGSGRPRETAAVRQSRKQLIARLGILPSKSKY
jgi:hypothetical protein